MYVLNQFRKNKKKIKSKTIREISQSNTVETAL